MESKTPITDAAVAVYGLRPYMSEVVEASRKLETRNAALIAALTRYKAAVDSASFDDSEMTPEFNREIMEASAQVAAALASVQS